MSVAPTPSARRPELVFALVGPLGTDLAAASTHLTEALAQVHYSTQVVRLSQTMREIPAEPWSLLRDDVRDVQTRAHIDAGNRLRKELKRNDAVAMLGVGALREFRKQRTGDVKVPAPALAYIFHSLKRPEEIEILQRIYGPALIVLAAYSPRARRVQHLARLIAESHHSNQAGAFFPKAEELIVIDEAETENIHGQDVRDAFAIADVIVNTSDQHSLPAAIRRFVEILFGNTLQTPTRDEQGMYLAHGAALRSASLARQVGAVICREDGSIVSLGSNEVARSGGGQYWPHHYEDARDFRLGRDTSDQMRENLLADILNRLRTANWLSEDRRSTPLGELVKKLTIDIPEGADKPIMKGAQFMATIDYVRAVHAEMAAITDAARHGVCTVGTELYTTTFPCHDCAKHIVAAGIKRVVFIEPYPKSLIPELYSDSISVDSESDCGSKVRIQPFVGIAPKRYVEWFALMKRRRKSKDGIVAVWRASDASPQLPERSVSIPEWLNAEADEFKKFKAQLQSLII